MATIGAATCSDKAEDETMDSQRFRQRRIDTMPGGAMQPFLMGKQRENKP